MEMAVRIHAINVQSAAQRVRFSASSVDLSTRLRDEALLIVGPLSRVHRVCVRRFFCSACRSGEFSRMICSIDDQSPPAKLIVLRCRTRRALLSRGATRLDRLLKHTTKARFAGNVAMGPARVNTTPIAQRAPRRLHSRGEAKRAIRAATRNGSGLLSK